MHILDCSSQRRLIQLDCDAAYPALILILKTTGHRAGASFVPCNRLCRGLGAQSRSQSLIDRRSADFLRYEVRENSSLTYTVR